jgi:NitT/TauT family transport system ATP-binding protein
MEILRIEDVTFSYGRDLLINGASLKMHEGETVALVGPSGIGKTTLLKLICGIVQPQSGNIFRSPHMTYLSQEDMLLPWRTVMENILLPLELGRCKKDLTPFIERALHFLHILHLTPFRDSLPITLSGGMKKLVGLVRTLVQEKDLYLLDEPFSHVDLYLREKVIPILRSYVKEKKCSLLFVSHDFRDASLLADRILFFGNGAPSYEWTVGDSLRASFEEQGKLLEAIRAAHTDLQNRRSL